MAHLHDVWLIVELFSCVLPDVVKTFVHTTSERMRKFKSSFWIFFFFLFDVKISPLVNVSILFCIFFTINRRKSHQNTSTLSIHDLYHFEEKSSQFFLFQMMQNYSIKVSENAHDLCSLFIIFEVECNLMLRHFYVNLAETKRN